MTEQRKHMRIALSEAEYAKFKAVKAKAEAVTRIQMSDPQYAASLIRFASREAGDD
tara:strand:- start:166 stop:333 length:168 start_codon:yes stop_codon:yes gene_type:complete